MQTTRATIVATLVLLLAGCGGHKPSSRGSSASAVTAAPTTSAAPLVLGMARAEHESILLPSGEILVVGGFDSAGEVLASTELVSASGVRPGPRLASPRVGHSLTLLADGRVLIAGGLSTPAGDPLGTSELFDPTSEQLMEGPALAQARAHHAAFVLGEGVILAGGRGPEVLVSGARVGSSPLTTPVGPGARQGAEVLLDTCERLDPATGQSALLPLTLSQPQRDLRGAAISPLQFVIAGGQGAQGPAPAEVFDGVQLQPTGGDLPRAGATVAFDGTYFLVVGGEVEGALRDDLEAFDGLGFRPVAAGVTPRRDAAADVAPAGLVIAGGLDAEGATDEVEVVAPGGNALLAPLALARVAHTLTLDREGRSGFAIGGYDAEQRVTASIETIAVPALAPQGGWGTGGSYATAALEVGVDGKLLGALLRAAGGAKCGQAGSQSASAPTPTVAAFVPAAELSALLLRVADSEAPSQAELLQMSARPDAAEFVSRLSAALQALGVQDAQLLAEETQAQMRALCAVSFPGHDLKAFLRHYEGKSHPAKDLLIARHRLYAGLDATIQATRLASGERASLDGELRRLAAADTSAGEVADRIRAALMAAASQEERGRDSLNVLGLILNDQGKAVQPVAPTNLFPAATATMANPAATPVASAPASAPAATASAPVATAGVQAP